MDLVQFAGRLSMSGRAVLLAALLVVAPYAASAKVVVFEQPGFPTIASDPVDHATLARVFDGDVPVFANLAALKASSTLADANLLVLPYGSAVPVDAWSAIEQYLQRGGNLLVIGGQPLYVPVQSKSDGLFPDRPQDTFARALGLRHTYEVPVASGARFQWREGYELATAPRVHARHFFAVEGRLDGLGYMADDAGLLQAAPVIVADHVQEPIKGSRVVALDFDPEPGYWQSSDGMALLRAVAAYAVEKPVQMSVEAQFSAIRPGEIPVLRLHLNGWRTQPPTGVESGTVTVTLHSQQGIVDSAKVPVMTDTAVETELPFHKPLPQGFYTVTAVYKHAGGFRDFYRNGFWVKDPAAVASGPVLGVHGDFLTRNGAPFLPVGTNYFSTESNGWDFSGPRNAWIWERDFAEMEQHGVTFVRTGVWMPYGRIVENTAGGGANERFLRNLEAFLLCAQRHHIAVNFTFFAFAPRASDVTAGEAKGDPPNPYLDPAAVGSEQAYVRSVLERFKDVPYLSWDLINEPSFSNPRTIFHGNVPNGDAVELAAWHKWLRSRYGDHLEALAEAWSDTPQGLGGFESIPLPAAADLNYERYGNPRLVRALDYNLFAQDMFGDWVKGMVGLIRATGSRQLVDVGQDEGGVTDRLLNQFYGASGVSFTTNHTYWQDDALLWDSVAARRPGIPNITGETGYQPVWAPDGSWRYDEFTGLGITERKWAMGFAAGSSGAMQWDWDREVDFGMKRSDGSPKVWENEMRGLGEFAKAAAPFATAISEPEVAIVLPQSLQLSVDKQYAIEAQQAAVRALFVDARSQAYAVGEYQIDLFGSPKLILLPSPYALGQAAWDAILQHVKDGAILLITGPFDGDAHLHATKRQDAIGLSYTTVPLTLRAHAAHFPWGDRELTFAGSKTTVLSRAQMPDGSDWAEKSVGKGKILFSALPLELNDNSKVVGEAYRYALKMAGVPPVYATDAEDPGISIVPTLFPKATLYVITSESNRTAVEFTDARSGHRFEGKISSGAAAIILVGTDGDVLAGWNWPGDNGSEAASH